MKSTYDFSGWATKNDFMCSDGRIIRKDAFKCNDGQKVPLVWNHQHDNPDSVLGHAMLENRDEGVYAYCSLNDSETGQTVRKILEHGDIGSLSIYANKLKQKGPNVMHGVIREVSLVLSGANPGATIESVSFAHGEDGDEEEAWVYLGEGSEGTDFHINHSAMSESSDDDDDEIQHADEEDNENQNGGEEMKNPKEIFDAMSEEQQDAVAYIVGLAVEQAMEDEGGSEDMKHNAFDEDEVFTGGYLSHADEVAIIEDAKKNGKLSEAFLEHSADYGIENLGLLFPDYTETNDTPEFIKRDTGWVGTFMGKVKKLPFSRIKSTMANITEEDARALGYIKGNRKKEEVFPLLRRTTDPQTIYKKQKMDRDDIIDITDMDVVAFIKGEMRGMLDEEIARAALVGDGRNRASEDHISEDHIRPVWTDDDLYTIKQRYAVAPGTSAQARAKEFIRQCIRARKTYKGSGQPTAYMTEDTLTECLLIEDVNGRVIYDSVAKLATALRVSSIETVEVMEGLGHEVGSAYYDLKALILNPNDYAIGADKGGNVNMFDDFDIDFNQYKYLIETRCSGALRKPFSAIAVEETIGNFITFTPVDPTETVLGKTVSSLQSNIMMNDKSIEGTLNYVTGYTGYSGDPKEQSGNYFAYHVAAPTGATIVGELIGGTTGPVTFDEDGICVTRVSNNNQKIKITVTTTTGEVMEKIYSLRLIDLESAN